MNEKDDDPVSDWLAMRGFARFWWYVRHGIDYRETALDWVDGVLDGGKELALAIPRFIFVIMRPFLCILLLPFLLPVLYLDRLRLARTREQRISEHMDRMMRRERE